MLEDLVTRKILVLEEFSFCEVLLDQGDRRHLAWRRSVKIPSLQKNALLFLQTRFLVAFTTIFVSQGFSICFQSAVAQVLPLCLRRTDILDTL